MQILRTAPSAAVLEAALVVLMNKPGAGMKNLLDQGTHFTQTLVLCVSEPYIEGNFLLSGAKSYSSRVEVNVPLVNA